MSGEPEVVEEVTVKTWDDFDTFKASIEDVQTAIDGIIEQVAELPVAYPLQQKEKALQYLGYSRAELGKLVSDTEVNLRAEIGVRKVKVEEPPVEPDLNVGPPVEPTSPPSPFEFGNS